jgi:hypothetical protein
MQFENRTIKRSLLSMSQQGFIPPINGYGEHISLANMPIIRALTEHRILYFLALDMRDAFGSVSHMQLKNNLSKIIYQVLVCITDWQTLLWTVVMRRKSKLLY